MLVEDNYNFKKYTLSENHIKKHLYITYEKKSNDPYLKLQANLRYVDLQLKKYLRENNRKSVKMAYKKYLEYPIIPKKVNLSDLEIKLKANYIADHFPLVNDIRNEREFQALTIIFGEFKISLSTKKDLYETHIFKKISSISILNPLFKNKIDSKFKSIAEN